MGSIEPAYSRIWIAMRRVWVMAKSSNAGDKARLLQMAQAWRDLAEKRDNENRNPGEHG